MNELKDYNGDVFKPVYGSIADARVYLKSEADAYIRRQKYKRCLAMAQEWRNYAAFCGMQFSCHNHRGFGKTAEKWTWKECHAWKCVKRWLELAEKFKTNKE